jgi:hypothetical protein
MKVYVLMEVVPYQYGIPLGVYSSKEAAEIAKAAEDTDCEDACCATPEYHIEEHEVKDTPLVRPAGGRGSSKWEALAKKMKTDQALLDEEAISEVLKRKEEVERLGINTGEFMSKPSIHRQPVARPDRLRTIISTVEVKKAQKPKRNWLMALVDRARYSQKDKDDIWVKKD